MTLFGGVPDFICIFLIAYGTNLRPKRTLGVVKFTRSLQAGA